MMELGATICTPRAPQCLLCPVAKFCRARKLGIQDLIPEKRKKRDTVGVTLASAILSNAQGRCILLPPPKFGARKTATNDIPTLVSGMWHFPTIAVGTNPERELRNYLSKNFVNAEDMPRLTPLNRVRHAVTYRAITLIPFRVEFRRLPHIPGAKIIRLEDFASVPVSNLTRKVARVGLEAVTKPNLSA